MSFADRRLSRSRRKHLRVTDHAPRAENDVAVDRGLARSRAHGGPPRPGDVSDAATTTGTAENQLFVGRIAGDDLGYVGETGAEARASSPTRAARST